jgi:hypothetical protein
MAKRLALVLIPAALVALVAVPILIDQPFGAQSDRTLAFAFAMRRWSPLVSIVAALTLLGVVVSSWRERRGWLARAGWAVSLAVTLGAAWVAWQNPFEWMFNPLAQPQYVPASRASFVDAGDLVLAVTRDGDAAAYPIRQIAYHHVINDRIGRTPAVVTY